MCNGEEKMIYGWGSAATFVETLKTASTVLSVPLVIILLQTVQVLILPNHLEYKEGVLEPG